MFKKQFLFLLPIFIFGAFYVKHIYDKNKAMERKINQEEVFLVGKWANIKAIAPDGKVTEYEQGPGCFITRRDLGSALRKYEGYKPAGFNWYFTAEDSLLMTFKSNTDSSKSYVRVISPDILVLTSLEDSIKRIQMRYTGKQLSISNDKLRALGVL